MDLLSELENMAVNVGDKPDNDAEPDIETVKRWQYLFQYTYTEASEHIKDHHANLSRTKVSDEHWAIVRPEKEAEGYDRDAYEYAMVLRQTKRPQPAASPGITTEAATTSFSEPQKRAKFLLKLEGFLDSAEKVREIGELALTPSVISGTSDSGESSFFCHINNAEKQAILNGLSDIDFRPTFIKVSKAEKALSNTSIYPTLGMDSTLPQHRLADTYLDAPFSPGQDEYPVWYFFYGTLADAGFLLKLLSLSQKPELRPARIYGGIIRTWAGRYRAMVDAAFSGKCVDGSAYLVNSREHEEILQYYETEKYEVVRCSIRMNDNAELILGLTFRFVESHDLD